ncbi:MAG: DNA polymerase III subunit gamma/tau [Coriobacteriia bacterium]|nr:DNA polymerase III subunit gamma/tau [Coriobacteriia bacterium]
MESLYTKYRPQTFEQVVGQKHVVETLMRAVSEHKTSHAYLFCGPRGTGKTTMARLLAKALMCEKGEGQMPDGTCEQCRLIAAGEHPDVAELDAASRTGVDNVRDEIISRVNYAPTMGRYKVYIIDEVHMLTTAAFNALLKTLEEPPEHVVFIMCTTDPQKVLPTILSRVQRFDFHSIAPDEMQAHLAYVCGREGFTYDDAALELIVRHARGGMRDALTSLEQLSVFGDGNIGVKAAQDFLGEVSGSVLGTTSTALAQRDVPTLFAEVEKLVGSGRDLLQFTRELASHVRDVYVCAVAPEAAGAVSATGEALDALRAEAAAFGSADRVARALTVLGDASSEMRTATNQRLVLEIAFTRIARPETDLTLESLADRLAILEQKVASGQLVAAQPAVPAQQPVPVQPASAAQPAAVPAGQPVAPAPSRPAAAAQAAVPTQPPARTAPTAAQPTPAPAPAHAAPAAPASAPTARTAPAAPAALQRAWKQVVDTLVKTTPAKGSLVLSASPVSDDGETLTIGLPAGSRFALRMLERSDVRAAVEPVIESVLGARKLAVVEQGAASASARAAAPAPSRPAPSQAPAPAPRQASPSPASQAAPQPRPAAPAAPQRASRPASQPPVASPASFSAPEPEYAPASAYADVAPAEDYPMPWDAPAQTPAPQAAQPVSAQPAAAQAHQDAPAPEPQPAAAPAPQPATAPLADAPAAAQVENITPEFSDILSDLTAVFGAPTKVSVEAANPGPDDADLSYDDEGAGAADADSPEFADEPVDDADEDE